MSQVSDELLLAYLDGQLDAPQAQSVERMIGANEALRSRFDRLKTTQGYLVQTFETLVRRTREQPRPAGDAHPRKAPSQAGQAGRPREAGEQRGHGEDIRLSTQGGDAQEKPARRSPRRMLAWAGVLSVVAAVLGYGAGQWMRLNNGPGIEKIAARAPAPANRWAEDVATLHSHFTTASVAAEPESQTNQDLVALQISRIVNKSLQVPDFSDHELTFRRGQVLSYRGSRMMQLSYAGGGSGLVALYVMSGGPSASASVATRGDVATINWSKDGVRYVLAGKLPETDLRALSAVVMSQLGTS